MRAVEITQPGAPEVLIECSRPVPQAAAGEVLIKVAAAGINRPDVLQRQGNYKPPPGTTDIPGLEVAGEIIALGSGVGEWKIGDKVCALVAGGGYAEYCVAPAVQCLPIPKGLGMSEAAVLPETFFTVWSNVFDRAKLSSGETFMVQGGSSGIGTTAIQLARAMGHRVFATAGSDDKCAACEKLGAEKAINYKTQDFVEEIKKLTNGKGVDVILDMVAGDYIPREVKCLADDGRIVLIAFLRGPLAQMDFKDVLMRRLTITGSTLRPRPIAFKGAIAKNLREKVWPLIEAGKIKPVMHSSFALRDAAKAHALMESSEHIGKIVLTIG
ncbi:MAG: NAD(P)H-quinone oxidoreductase [Burkholderiales bacterium]